VFVKRTSCRNTAFRLVGSQIGADVLKDWNASVFKVHLSTFFRLLGPEDGGNIIIRNVGIYLYSETNQMHNISNLFYFGTTLYMFLTVSVHHQESKTVHTALATEPV
jgi:hypothetical protein